MLQAASKLLFVTWGIAFACVSFFPLNSDADDRLAKFAAQYCVQCHGADVAEGNIRFDGLHDRESPDFGPRWTRAYERIVSGEMPPSDADQPSDEERYAVAEAIAGGLATWDETQQARSASVVFKRLSRVEYAHTLEDLLGFRYYPSDPGGLPEDPQWHGIERIGSVLSLSPSHIERYLSAAELALQQRIPLSDPPKPWSYEWLATDVIQSTGYQSRLASDPQTPRHRLLIGPGNNWKHYVGGLTRIITPHAGKYRIQVQASGLRPNGGSAPHVVIYDANIDRTLLEQDVEAAEESPKTIEAIVWLPAGAHDLIVRNELPGPTPYEPHQRGGNVDLFTTLKAGRSPFLQKVSDDSFQPYQSLLILDRVTIDAVFDDWPPATQRRWITAGAEDDAHASAILREFGLRAFRRPLTPSQLERFLDVVRQTRQSGSSFALSIREAMLAMLCSHEFLFLVEGDAQQSRSKLDDYELASRLSYFLWSTMPDDELLAAAEDSSLHERGSLAAQSQRMIDDPRSQRFAEDFARQWLGLHDVGKFPPDKKRYPSYDPALQRSMIAEPQAFVAEVFRQNLSIAQFIQSDWTMVNDRLADHYGIPGVVDYPIRRVGLESTHHRGGLLTQASILSLTSDGFRHRPVHRGKWVSEVFYGITPPPPPPNAGTIPASPEGAAPTTLREKLEAHRQQASCAACHAKIDPLGFAFDHYDAIGRWQTVDSSQGAAGQSPAVDASGTLADGRSYSGPDAFKQLLLEDLDQIAHAFTQRLATYALRRPLTFSEKKTLQSIVIDSKPDGYRFRSLVERLIASDLFQRR
jgi:hypothetical protein